MRGEDIAPITERMLSYMPPWFRSDPMVQAILDALGREQQRIADAAEAVGLGLFPQNATDGPYGNFLSLWETLLGLPVAPTGVSTENRQAYVLAAFRGRDVTQGSSWVAAIDLALGGNLWTYQEGPDDYTINIFFSLNEVARWAVEGAIRQITPAHLDAAFGDPEGFIVGEGFVGEDRL